MSILWHQLCPTRISRCWKGYHPSCPKPSHIHPCSNSSSPHCPLPPPYLHLMTKYWSSSEGRSMSHSITKLAGAIWVILIVGVQSNQSWPSHDPTFPIIVKSLTWALVKVHGPRTCSSTGRRNQAITLLIIQSISSWVTWSDVVARGKARRSH